MSQAPTSEERPDVAKYPGGEALYRLRHSAAHVLATAVTDLFPEVKVAGGPPIENGFYYDFARETPFTPEDLERIEARMREIVAENQPFEHSEATREEAQKRFEAADEKYKLHFLSQIPDGARVTYYKNGRFLDLCRGPHVASTGQLKAFKLTHVAGAYWLGSEKNEMLQRIYGTAFETQAELDAYLVKVEEALRRDHRRLGRELDLFSIQEEIGPGLVLWHPRLGIVRHVMETLWKDLHYQRGYQFVYTPHIASEKLYEISGHLENYADIMYAPMQIDEQAYRVKPMNCPGHIMIYNTHKHSYRDLPIRMAELGTVYRYERSGVLHGMERVRGFTQDDSHIFCTPEQLADEVSGILDLMDFLLKTYVKLKDALGRLWQCPTIQVDLNLPKRFGVTYTGPDGKDHECIMLHRALYGSLERFAGIYIEHTGGVRVEIDRREEKLGAKIRDAELEKVPYMLVVGPREAEAGTVAPRKKGEGQLEPMTRQAFLDR